MPTQSFANKTNPYVNQTTQKNKAEFEAAQTLKIEQANTIELTFRFDAFIEVPKVQRDVFTTFYQLLLGEEFQRTATNEWTSRPNNICIDKTLQLKSVNGNDIKGMRIDFKPNGSLYNATLLHIEVEKRLYTMPCGVHCSSSLHIFPTKAQLADLVPMLTPDKTWAKYIMTDQYDTKVQYAYVTDDFVLYPRDKELYLYDKQVVQQAATEEELFQKENAGVIFESLSNIYDMLMKKSNNQCVRVSLHTASPQNQIELTMCVAA